VSIDEIPFGELYGSKEAAEYVGLAPGRFRLLAAQGTIASVKRNGRRYFTRQQLDDFRALTRPNGRPRNPRLKGKWVEQRRESARTAQARRKGS
jgi:hypothetical protein